MQTLNMYEVQQIAGGGFVEALAIAIGIELAMAAGNHFAQDNGGPSAADWAASVGYVG